MTTTTERRRKGPPPGPPLQASLGALQDEQRAAAQAAAGVTERELAERWVEQCRHVADHITALQAALDHNLPLLRDADDPRWERYWLIEARRRYEEETLALLSRRLHALFCPNCDAEGLSLRGLLGGEGPLAWSRYCEPCARSAPIAAAAAALFRAHREDRP